MRKLILLTLLCGCGRSVPPEPGATAPVASEALTSPCETADPKRPILAGATGTEAFVVRADGTRQVLLTVAPNNAWVAPPLVRGRYLAVSSSAQVDGQYVSRMHLFDAEGRPLASAEGVSHGYLSERGVVAAHAPGGGLRLFGEGLDRTREGLWPMGEFGPAGELPVWAKSPDAEEWRLALYLVDRDALREVPLPLQGWGSPAWFDGQLVYLSEREGTLQLVRVGETQAQVTPLVGLADTGGLSVEAVAGGKAVLTAGAWVQSRFVVDLATGAVAPLEVELPEGMGWAGRRSPALAEDGSLVTAFVRGSAAGLFESKDGKAWAELGAMHEGANRVLFAGRGGAWLVSAASTLLPAQSTRGFSSAFARELTLPAIAGGHAPEAESLSADGRCAAVWHAAPGGFALTVANLALGTQRQLLHLEAKSAPASASWIH